MRQRGVPLQNLREVSPVRHPEHALAKPLLNDAAKTRKRNLRGTMLLYVYRSSSQCRKTLTFYVKHAISMQWLSFT